MRNYCDCGDYCAWCRPDLCTPPLFVILQPRVKTVRNCVRNEECGMKLPRLLDPRYREVPNAAQ